MPKNKVAAKAVSDSKKPKALMKEKQRKAAEKKTKMIKKTAPAEGGMKEGQKIRRKAGTVALREIKRYQKSLDVIIPRAPFQRLVK